MIDDTTRTHFEQVRVRAREQGMDLAEALDRAGLLLTKRRKRLTILAVLMELVNELEQVHPSAMLLMGSGTSEFHSGHDHTPDGMFRACLRWVNAWVRRFE